MKRRSSVIAAAAVIIPAACSQPDPSNVICTAMYAYGINVGVQDSLTGVPVASGATAIARDGAYADSASIPASANDNASIGLAGERAGVYSVTVKRAGYSTWLKSSVQVTKDVCHVHPVSLTAKLKPL